MNDLKDINTNKDLLSSLDNNNDENNNNIEDEIEEKEIVFRNYIPQDRNFKMEKCYKMDEVKSIEEKIKQNVLKSVKEFLNLEKNNVHFNLRFSRLFLFSISRFCSSVNSIGYILFLQFYS